MKLDRDQLQHVLVDIARKRYGRRHFERGVFLADVEEHLRKVGAWESTDDEVNPPHPRKSRGQKNIDFCFTDLAANGSFENFGRNNWGLAASLEKDPLDF